MKSPKQLKLFSQYPDYYNSAQEVELMYKLKISPSQLPRVNGSVDAADVLRPIFPKIEYKEYFYILLLNRNNHVIGHSLISMGGLAGTVIDVRIILQTAILSNACSIILSHNHPSGNLFPSDADKEITRKIKDAGKHMDIPVLDHLIMSKDSYFSFADEGII